MEIHGLPEVVICDQGMQICIKIHPVSESAFWGSPVAASMVYHLQTDGQDQKG